MQSKRDIWSVLTLTLIVLYTLFLLYPLLSLLSQSIYNSGSGGFSLEHFMRFFSKKYYYSAIWNSLSVTFAVTASTVLVAMPLAWIMSKVKIKGKRIIEILFLISTLSPPVIGA